MESITFTPEMVERVCQIAAEKVTNELRAKAGGDFANWFLIPLATAAQMVGMTTKQLPKRIPVTQWGPSSHGVLFGVLIDKLKERTVNPDGTPAFPKTETKDAT